MRAVADERERIRQRERDRLAKTEKVSLRQSPKQVVQKVVADFNLGKWLAQEAARDKLVMAGFRGEAPYMTFLFFRLVTPIVLFIATAVYVFFIAKMEQSLMVKLGICVVAAYRRHARADDLSEERDQEAAAVDQARVSRCARSAADLRRIRHVGGAGVPQGVGRRSASQSIPLAEEFTLTTAELSYLSDRKVAYENLQKRTGLDGVKSVCMALAQSERYGTPLGTTLRVMAQENRDAAHDGSGEEGRVAAADADGADGAVLPAGAVRRDPRADRHQDLRDDVSERLLPAHRSRARRFASPRK